MFFNHIRWHFNKWYTTTTRCTDHNVWYLLGFFQLQTMCEKYMLLKSESQRMSNEGGDQVRIFKDYEILNQTCHGKWQ